MIKFTVTVWIVIACATLTGCQILSSGTGIKSVDQISTNPSEKSVNFYRVDRALIGSGATLYVSFNGTTVEMNEGDFWQASGVKGISQIEVQFPGGIRDSLVFEGESSFARYFLVGAIGDKENLIKEVRVSDWKQAID